VREQKAVILVRRAVTVGWVDCDMGSERHARTSAREWKKGVDRTG
jgi:hypothetical protein